MELSLRQKTAMITKFLVIMFDNTDKIEFVDIPQISKQDIDIIL
jgi:hypothetical protein